MSVTFLAAWVAAIALVIRWRTWTVPSERGATVGVVCVGLGCYLISTECKLGALLWHATGYGYIDVFLGHLLWLVGLLAMIYHALYRLAGSAERDAILNSLVAWPVTLVVPLMCSAAYMSAAMREHPAIDLNDVQTVGPWLPIYRAVWFVAMTYFAGLLIRLLLVVRRTGTGKNLITNLYLVACWVMLTAVALRMASFADVPGTDELVELLRCVVVMLVSATAAWSWVGKTWPHRRLIWSTLTTRRQLRRDTLDAHRRRLIGGPGELTADEAAI